MNQVTSNLLNTFEQFRMPPTSNDQYLAVGRDKLGEKMQSFVNRNVPIEFVMLGFPFKSANTRDKVLGVLPDLAEELTLKQFTRFGQEMAKVYPQGVKVNVVSDGFVFNDVLEVPDRTVIQYREVSEDLGKYSPVRFYDLRDFYNEPLKFAREKLMGQFGISSDELQRRILFDADVNYLYRGMTIFMREELAIKDFPSGNQLQKAAKKLTRDMMMRNEAYSALVREEFKDHIRLSMHNSVNSGAKYSFQLIDSPKAYHSAWHCAIAVSDNGEVETVHRRDAEQRGDELVIENGRPYYFHSKN